MNKITHVRNHPSHRNDTEEVDMEMITTPKMVVVIFARCIWIDKINAYIELPGGLGGKIPISEIFTPISEVRKAKCGPIFMKIGKIAFLNLVLHT